MSERRDRGPTYGPPITRIWGRWKLPLGLAVAVLFAILVFALWYLYAGLLLIAVGAGLVFAAWSAYELHFYAKYGEYDVDIGSVSAFTPKYSYRAKERISFCD